MNVINEICSAMLFSFFGLAGVVGLVALVSPKIFTAAAELGGMWVTNPKSASTYHSPIDIDQFVIRHSRKFGALVVTVVGFLTLLFLGRIDPSWMPVFLLVVSGASVFFVYSGLMELGGEVCKIETQLADARIDPLTQLANRRAFDEELERRFSERSRTRAGFCVAIIDVDKFKEVNDRFGHLAGDTVLAKGVADVLRSTKRTMDLAARYGGDEFAVIYPASNLQEASIAAEHIRAAVASEPLPLEDAEFAITVSIGVAEATEGDDATTIMKRADDALYAAKHKGRNRVGRYNGERSETIAVDKVLL
ncbi:GGDEF domain-containing protein [Pirellulales bacterium]|nr:GGDEF domain-containing protein [Pirellulales bacterium]